MLNKKRLKPKLNLTYITMRKDIATLIKLTNKDFLKGSKNYLISIKALSKMKFMIKTKVNYKMFRHG